MDNQVPPQNKKIFYGAISAVAVIVVFIVITIISFFINKKNSSQNQPQNVTTTSNTEAHENQSPSSIPSINPDQVKSWKTYQNLNFSIKYPPDWKEIENYPDGTYLALQSPTTKTGKLGNFAIE